MKKDCLTTITLNPEDLYKLRISDFKVNPEDERIRDVFLKMCESVRIGGKVCKICVEPITITGHLDVKNLHYMVEKELGEGWLPIDETTYFQLLARGIMRKDCTMEQLARNAASLGGYEDSDKQSKPVGDIVELLGGYHSTVVLGKNNTLRCYGGDNNCYGDSRNCPWDCIEKLHMPPGKETGLINNFIKKRVTYGIKVE